MNHIRDLKLATMGLRYSLLVALPPRYSSRSLWIDFCRLCCRLLLKCDGICHDFTQSMDCCSWKFEICQIMYWMLFRHFYCFILYVDHSSHTYERTLTLILPTWRIWWAPNTSKWHMGFKFGKITGMNESTFIHSNSINPYPANVENMMSS